MRSLTGGLTGVIYQLAFAPDGQSLLARDSPRRLGTWDVTSGGFRTWPRNPPDAVAFAFDPTGAQVGVANWAECRFYRWPGGTAMPAAEQAPRWAGSGTIQAVAFDPGGRRLAIASNGLIVWDTVALTRQGTRGEGPLAAVAFVPNTATVVAVNVARGGAAGWNYRTGRERFFVPVAGAALAVACSPDGSVIAVGAGGGVDLLDPAGKQVGRGEIPGLATVTDLAFTPDGRRLLVAAGTPRVTALDPRTAAEVGAFDFGVDKAFAVAVAPDGLTAAVGGMGGRVVVFDIDG